MVSKLNLSSETLKAALAIAGAIASEAPNPIVSAVGRIVAVGVLADDAIRGLIQSKRLRAGVVAATVANALSHNRPIWEAAVLAKIVKVGKRVAIQLGVAKNNEVPVLEALEQPAQPVVAQPVQSLVQLSVPAVSSTEVAPPKLFDPNENLKGLDQPVNGKVARRGTAEKRKPQDGEPTPQKKRRTRVSADQKIVDNLGANLIFGTRKRKR